MNKENISDWKTLCLINKILTEIWMHFSGDSLKISIPEMEVFNFEISMLTNSSIISFYLFNASYWGKFILYWENSGLLGEYKVENKKYKLNFVREKFPKKWRSLNQCGVKPLEKDLLELIRKNNFNENIGIKIDIDYPNKDIDEFQKIRNFCKFNFSEKTDLQSIIYMTRWVNRYFKAGQVGDISKKNNALDFLQDKPQGMNCKTYSIVLNEILNAYGKKARMVQCLPYNRLDIESHYVNEVFSIELDKWIIADAAFGNIICSEKNEALNIQETRIKIGIKEKLKICMKKDILRDPCYNDYWYGITKNFFQFKIYRDYFPGFFKRNNSVFIVPSNFEAKGHYTFNISQFYK